nr:PREDICTED: putative ATP-dependent DNA helicase Q1 [Bemisia tabaci]
MSLRKEISYKVIDITDVSASYKSLEGVEKNPLPLMSYLHFADYPNQQLIIFAENIKKLEKLRGAFKELNVEPAIFHGSLTDARKSSEITNWLSGERQILLTTSAVSLGVSNPRCSVTVHLGPSSSVNNFIQESGRAGRKGQESTCLVILDSSFTYRKMCRSIEYRQSLDLKLYNEIKPGTTSKGNNQLLAWYVVTQRHTCIQQVLIKSIDPSATPDKCGKCSNCTSTVQYEHLQLERPLRNLLLHVREVEDRRGACVLAVAKFFAVAWRE